MSSIRLAAGATNGTSWITQNSGAKLSVDTSSGNYSKTPVHTVSIGAAAGACEP